MIHMLQLVYVIQGIQNPDHIVIKILQHVAQPCVEHPQEVHEAAFLEHLNHQQFVVELLIALAHLVVLPLVAILEA